MGKEEVKLPLLADDIVLVTENPTDAAGKLLELIKGFGEVAGCKINTQKSLEFLYINNKKTERENKKQFHSPLQ